MQTKRPAAAIGAIVAAAVLASGCAKSAVTTTVGSSGSYTRDLTFSTDAGMGSTVPSLRQSFKLPTGALWKTNLTKTHDTDTHTETYTAHRTFAPGDVDSKDLVVLTGKHTTLANSTSIRQIKPGVWEYREALHWDGHAEADEMLGTKELIPLIEKALPSTFATRSNARILAKSILPQLRSSVLGPPRPLLYDAIGNPDLAIVLLGNDISKSLHDSLQQQFGNKMTPEQQAGVVRRVISLVIGQLTSSGNNKAYAGPDTTKFPDADSSHDAGSLTSLTFVLRPPGKVLSTNGIYNEYTGEVVWGLYPEAARSGDVILTADYLSSVDEKR